MQDSSLLVKGYYKVVHKVIKLRIWYLIKRYPGVKIGKTSTPKRRFHGYKREGYDKMYIMYTSKHEASVEKAEAFFNDYFYDWVLNQKRGSAGRLSRVSGQHYLYCSVMRSLTWEAMRILFRKERLRKSLTKRILQHTIRRLLTSSTGIG